MPKKTVTIIGQGYVGLPLAHACWINNYQVQGIEIDPARRKLLESGKSPIDDIQDKSILEMINSGTYRVYGDYKCLKDTQIVVICVPTPLGETRKPDISILNSVVRELATELVNGTLIINESTSFPGTVREVIADMVSRNFKGNAESLYFSAAPERINPGSNQGQIGSTPRVVGGLTKFACEMTADFYRSLGQQVVTVSSCEVAEMSKLLENTFRLVNISLVNQIEDFCFEIGIDMREVIEAASSKTYGFMPFWPGLGAGGHCIPVDPIYLQWSASKKGMDISLITQAHTINELRPLTIFKRVLGLLSAETNRSVHIAGIAYKSGVGDLRESAAVKLGELFLKEGFEVFWSDARAKEVSQFKKYSGEKVGILIINDVVRMTDIEAASVVVDLAGATIRGEDVTGL